MRNKKVLSLLLILIIGAFLRLWIFDFKVGFPDYDPFYHARMGEYIYSNYALPTWDYQELGGMPYYYSPAFHIFMVVGKFFLGSSDFISIGSLINVFFGVLSIIIFFSIVREHLNTNAALIASSLFTVSPIIALRTSMWARPTGLSIFFAILTVYAFTRLQKNRDASNCILMLVTLLGYIFSHSSVIAVVTALWIAVLLKRDWKFLKLFLLINIAAFSAGLFYYYRFLPFLNFSLGYTHEYAPAVSMSIISSLKGPSPTATVLTVLLYLSAFNLSSLPLILHGSMIFMKEKMDYLGILSIIAVFVAFFKINLFILFIFLLYAATAVSLIRISRISTYFKSRYINYGWSLGAFIFLSIFFIHFHMDNALYGERTQVYIEPIKNVLLDSDLSADDIVLANDMTVGHEIAYYSPASTFISVLTDTKIWSRNYRIYKIMYNENLTYQQAIDTLHKNNITHLLIINSSGMRSFPFLLNNVRKFNAVGNATTENVTITLYKIDYRKEKSSI